MSCESWRDPIALDAGGNLSTAEAAALARHLRGCAACRRFAEEMAASQQALRRLYRRPLVEASRARIRRGVLERIADGGVSRFRRSRPAIRWLALAASLLAVLSLWQLRDPRPPIDETERVEVQRPGPRIAVPPQASPAVPPPAVPAPPADESPRTADTDATPPPRRAGRPFQRRPLVELTSSPEPLESSPSLVVLAASRGRLVSSPWLTVLPSPGESLPSDTVVFLEPPTPPPAKPTLRRLSGNADYTIYWLDEPADTLKEKEDAYTKVL